MGNKGGLEKNIPQEQGEVFQRVICKPKHCLQVEAPANRGFLERPI
jgi:hypothetical protein